MENKRTAPRACSADSLRRQESQTIDPDSNEVEKGWHTGPKDAEGSRRKKDGGISREGQVCPA